MRTGAIAETPWMLHYVPVCLKTQGMCNEARCREPYTLGYIPDHLKTENICEKAVEKDPQSLKYVPDWVVTHQKMLRVMKLTIGRRCMFPHNDDDLIKWYEGYKKQKAQKTSIKEELMPMAWHLSRW